MKHPTPVPNAVLITGVLVMIVFPVFSLIACQIAVHHVAKADIDNTIALIFCVNMVLTFITVAVCQAIVFPTNGGGHDH